MRLVMASCQLPSAPATRLTAAAAVRMSAGRDSTAHVTRLPSTIVLLKLVSASTGVSYHAVQRGVSIGT